MKNKSKTIKDIITERQKNGTYIGMTKDEYLNLKVVDLKNEYLLGRYRCGPTDNLDTIAPIMDITCNIDAELVAEIKMCFIEDYNVNKK